MFTDSLLDNLDQVVSSSSSLIDNQDLIQATVTSQKIDLGSPDAVETFVNIKNVADKILLMDDDSEVARKVWPETSSEYLRQAEEKIRELDSATDTVLKAMAHLRVAIMGDKYKHGTLESTKSERSNLPFYLML